MSLVNLASSPFVAALGLALLHFLWQGAVIALFLGATLASLPRSHAAARYTAACAALALMALAPPLTFAYFHAALAVEPFVPPNPWATLSAPAEGSGPPLWPAIVVMAWCTGALFMSARIAVGLARLSSLIRHHTVPVSSALTVRFDKLAGRLGVRKGVRLLGSDRVDVPMVVGWLRPVVLVPLAALTDLPPSCLTALLAHELAHVRRFDFLTNILQSIVEAALFYHPAVHWVSRVARREREHLCDDDAVAAVGDPVRYARALAALEGMRARTPELALGSNGGSLVMRIRRLIDGTTPHAPTGRALAAPALALASTLGLALATLAACGGEQPAAVEKPGLAESKAQTAALGIPWLPPAIARWESSIAASAHKSNVDPAAVAILTLVESGGDPKAKSPAGALGLMQLMPGTAVTVATELGIADHADERLLDPAYNLDLGASYFGKQFVEFGKKDPARAFELSAAAYNGGENRVREWLDGKAELSEETEKYRALTTGMWNERHAARSTTYDTWRERVRGKLASRSSHPLPGARVTLHFGDATPGQTSAPHDGVDLAAAAGTTVLAPLDGTVDRIEKNAKGEPVLVLAHGRGIETRYRHLANVKAQPGTAVTRGDVLGEVGAPEGGPHVHFEVRDYGEAIDPARYLGQAAAP
ncbi:peptidoglycan DD-metalloendopeptidase family protein [Polyangium sp. 6x1]|uniref:peptidoglycan DD-metalloendopeptidase family protein n=1 Tax=Polyangium sp. 6x1 TaxID=3042689 RepID=UPI002482B9C4|nr:peptidoglycan DD-metalloendopeptidase family protein [Polyangium sp. 6x1]MDI1442845.1 peptidoglycan DD-metalloendopeptidase family protein [Polyangium sp. 6x1]